MSTLDICILGGTGFIGHSIVTRLAEQRHNITVISRHRERHRDLLVLPTVRVVQGDVHDPGFLRYEFQDVNVVINLVGILNESGRWGEDFEKVHAQLPLRVAETCKAQGVPRLLHMSALNAVPHAPSNYLRTKARGEDQAHQTGGDRVRVTSFRPSVVFGPGDSFINRFAGLLRMAPLVFPLACPNTRFQPVYVGDVAQAFVNTLSNHHTYGRRYDLCGPKVYTLREIVQYIADTGRLHRKIIGLSKTLSWLQAWTLGFVPGKPFSLDNYRSLQVDCICRGKFPDVLDIKPTPLEAVVPQYLRPLRRHHA